MDGPQPSPRTTLGCEIACLIPSSISSAVALFWSIRLPDPSSVKPASWAISPKSTETGRDGARELSTNSQQHSLSIYPPIAACEGGNLFSSVLLLLFSKLSPLGWQFVIYWVLLEFKLWPGHREDRSPSQPPSFLFHSVGSAACTFSLISKLGRCHRASLRGLRRSLEGTARVQWFFPRRWQSSNSEYGHGCKWGFLTHLNGLQAKWLFLSP